MAKLSKRMAAIRQAVDKSKEYSLVEGFEIISKLNVMEVEI